MTHKGKGPVQVVMPEIKLTIADLAYMTGLLPGGTRCHGGDKITDKLVFLGLIEKADIPPCSKAVAEFDAKLAEWRTKTTEAVKAERWENVTDLPYPVRENQRPKVKSDYILTSSGKEFMVNGRVSCTTSVKGGCL